jgi:spermidine synthase
MTYALLASVFVIASCGLVYELIAGAAASYLLGDSVTQFSTVIGAYLFAMGVGSYLSRYVGRGLVAKFVTIELLVGLVGGSSAAALFLVFSYLTSFKLMLYAFVIVVGVLVGLEIPLLLRILRGRLEFKDLVSDVLTFDYLGALIASLLFPLVLAPKLGLVRTCFLFGILNAVVAGWTAWLFRDQLPAPGRIGRQVGAVTLALLAGFVYANRLTAYAEEGLYSDEVIFAQSTPYQRIVLTRWRDDLRLFLNGHLQFSSRDEYRYHEALVHPGLAAVAHPRTVLVLGGGDGLAVREVLKYPTVESVTLVDLDPTMTKLFSTNPALVQLNQAALRDPRVHIVNADAFVWLDEQPGSFDFAVVDFPDPTNYSLGKLYTTAFYRLLGRHLSAHGAAAIQSTSPLFAKQSFWCIVRTVQDAGLHAIPYHAYVPSFGEWGFVVAANAPYEPASDYPRGLRFLSSATAAAMFEFPQDMLPVDVEVNRLNNQVLVQYYDSEWRHVSE